MVNRPAFEMTVDTVIDGTIDVDDLQRKIDLRVVPDKSYPDRVVPVSGIPFGRKFVFIHVTVRIDRTQLVQPVGQVRQFQHPVREWPAVEFDANLVQRRFDIRQPNPQPY